MASSNLDNLVKIGHLKLETPAQSEIDGLMNGARARMKDADHTVLSLESRFDLCYGAAHSLSLAALRWHGYRPDNRYAVFQSLVHTTQLTSAQVRVLSDAHSRRNRIAYEGAEEVSQTLIDSMMKVTKELLLQVEKLGPITAKKS